LLVVEEFGNLLRFPIRVSGDSPPLRRRLRMKGERLL